MNVTPRGVAIGLAAAGVGCAIGYAAGAAKHDPTDRDATILKLAAPAVIPLATGAALLVSNDIIGRGGAGLVFAASGLSMLAGAAIGEALDGHPF